MNLPIDKFFRRIGLLTCIGLGIYDAVQVIHFSFTNNRADFLYQPIGSISAAIGYFSVGQFGAWPVIAIFSYELILPLLIAGFMVAFWKRTQVGVARSIKINTALLVLQILLGLMVNAALLLLVVVELPLVLPGRIAWRWLASIILATVLVRIPYLFGFWIIMPYPDIVGSISGMGMMAVWFSVAYGVGHMAASERDSRVKIAAAHAELIATQLLLSDAVCASERVRIAHEVHDALGHHLTALNLHIELAVREADSAAVDSIQTARELAQRLLAEIRLVVSVEQKEQGINLRRALETLCSGIPSPKITLTFDDDVDVVEPSVAHTAFRSVQEAISNAVRHSGAAKLGISLAKNADGLNIIITDNGWGSDKAGDGNGLRGIRERVEDLGGKLSAGNRAEGGFGLQIWLPQVVRQS